MKNGPTRQRHRDHTKRVETKQSDVILSEPVPRILPKRCPLLQLFYTDRRGFNRCCRGGLAEFIFLFPRFGIHQRLEDVRDQIEHDDQNSEKSDRAQNKRIVTIEYRLDKFLANARDVKNLFHDEGTAEKSGKRRTEKRHDRE